MFMFIDMVVRTKSLIMYEIKTSKYQRSIIIIVELSCFGFPGKLFKTKDLPMNEITLLCLSLRDLEPVTQIIGGKWKKVPLDGIPEAEALGKTRYAVDFYRRDSSPESQ